MVFWYDQCHCKYNTIAITQRAYRCENINSPISKKLTGCRPLEISGSYSHYAVTRHYNDVIMCAMASQITSLTIVYSTVYSGANQRKHQSSASLALVRGIHRSPVNSPHKGPVTRKMFTFDDVIMIFIKGIYDSCVTIKTCCLTWQYGLSMAI